MKVLQIIPSFGIGGAEKVVLDYLKYYPRDAIQMKAISLYPAMDTIYDQEIQKYKLDVKYLDKTKGADLHIVKALKKEIKEFNPDIIHTHLYSLKYVFLTGELRNHKAFHTIHSQPKKDAIKIDWLINKICFQTGLVRPIALQKSLSSSLNAYYKIKKSYIIPNAICIEDYQKSVFPDLRTELGIPPDAFVIGHIGAFKYAKNHEFLIDVFQKISRLYDNVFLLLVGDGELKATVKSQVEQYGLQKRVIFTGNRLDIPDLLHIMDRFVFPSNYEGFGIVIVEAQAAGIPCIVSDRIPKEVFVTDSIINLPLEYSADKWAEEIMNPVITGKKYTDIQEFSITKIMGQLLSLYQNSSMEKKV